MLSKKKLKLFIAQQLFLSGKSGSEVNYIFCSDAELLEINRNYLNHDYYTDIITFDLSEKKSSFLLSDIYISVDRVKDNARQMETDFQVELVRVIFHGVLHLTGFKDKTVKHRQLMRSMEEKWIAAYKKFQQGL